MLLGSALLSHLLGPVVKLPSPLYMVTLSRTPRAL